MFGVDVQGQANFYVYNDSIFNIVNSPDSCLRNKQLPIFYQWMYEMSADNK